MVWKLDRLGRDLKPLVTLVEELRQQEVGFKVLTGTGAQIGTTTANGRLVLGIFAALAEFEAELIRERARAGITATTLYAYVNGDGSLKQAGQVVLEKDD